MHIAGVSPNVVSGYQASVDDVDDALQRAGSSESIIIFWDFNAHNGTHNETWKGVIGRHGGSAFNENRRCLS